MASNELLGAGKVCGYQEVGSQPGVTALLGNKSASDQTRNIAASLATQQKKSIIIKFKLKILDFSSN